MNTLKKLFNEQEFKKADCYRMLYDKYYLKKKYKNDIYKHL